MAWGSLSKGSRGQRDRVAAALYFARKKRIARQGGDAAPALDSKWGTPAGVMTVSPDGFTVSTSDGNAGNFVRGLQGRSTGLLYLEFSALALGDSGDFVGLATAGADLSGGYGVAGLIAMSDDQTVSNGTTFPLAPVGDPNGKTSCWAVNFTAGKFWARQNNGAWNVGGGGTQDPATNQGGLAFHASVTGTLFPACRLRGTSLSARLRTNTFLFAAPSGFSPWN